MDLANHFEIVVFDLGGVLAQIWHTWQGAARESEVSTNLDPISEIRLIDFPALDEYQMRSIDLETYLDRLSEWSGCPREDALKLHYGILISEYPGVEEVVKELEGRGVGTGCLSNTNAPHWEVLSSPAYPAIHRLEHKMASHLVGLNKPDQAIYRCYSETYNVSPERVVFFDDHAGNVAAANEFGFTARKIDPTGNTADQLRGHLADLGIL